MRSLSWYIWQASNRHAQSQSQPVTRLDVTTLRIVLRPQSYVNQLRQSQKQEPVAAPFIADLWMICVTDLPQAIEYPRSQGSKQPDYRVTKP